MEPAMVGLKYWLVYLNISSVVVILIYSVMETFLTRPGMMQYQVFVNK